MSLRYALTLALAAKVASAGWCGFYSDDQCQDQVGSVHYSTGNHNTFKNTGPGFSCNSGSDWTLIHYVPGSDENVQNCYHFPSDPYGSGICLNLTALGYEPWTNGEYRITGDKDCNHLSKREPEPEPEPEPEFEEFNEADLDKRSGAWIDFYSDKNCKDHVGSVSYSTGNHGCLFNSGSYMRVHGALDYKWHVEQYGTSQCSGDMTNCARAELFLDAQGQDWADCVPAEAAGLNPGSGTYKIEEDGCPFSFSTGP